MINNALATLDVRSLRQDRDVLEFTYEDSFGQPARGVVFQWRGELVAYRNLCPHWAVPLDHEGSFFDDSGHLLMCHHHGARFDPGSGECTFGPPEGQRLEKLEVVRLDDGVHAEVRRMAKLSLSF